MNIGWSDDFLLLEGTAAALAQVQQAKASDAAWVVIRWGVPKRKQPLVYVLSREEFYRRFTQMAGLFPPDMDVELQEVLSLKDLTPSVLVDAGERLRKLRRWKFHAMDLSGLRCGLRFVAISGSTDACAAVGGPDIVVDSWTNSAPLFGGSEPSLAFGDPLPSATETGDTADKPLQPAASGEEVEGEDEGSQPERYASIEPEAAVQAGQMVTLAIDLLADPSITTVGAAAGFDLQSDWSSIEVTAKLISPAIDFEDGGRCAITVRRNAASVSGTVRGRVHTGLAAGHPVPVLASFYHGTRMCGSATRLLLIGDGMTVSGPTGTSAAADGPVQVDLHAVSPDLTVHIRLIDSGRPGRLDWLMESIPFAARPDRMDGAIDLGHTPAIEASTLFHHFATLERGKHQRSIEGFGETLWQKSPQTFKDLYWALWDHLQRPFTIQFITDEPDIPWELMRPVRPSSRDVHPPLTLHHPVARWLLGYKGAMGKNQLPAGTLVTVTPDYQPGKKLRHAGEASKALVDQFGARPVAGNYDAMMELLESPPNEPVAMLFFNGHGAFSSVVASKSVLKLEDGGSLTPLDVNRREVILGERYGTVVFINACEVGATGSILGTVGGWADAFLARRFRAFIAPLWAIDEEDAVQVTRDLMNAIILQRRPLAEALRDVRARYADVSPTFYSYLLYGDVTARFA